MVESATVGRRDAFLGGLVGVLPLLVGVTPFGMIYGALAVGAGMPPAAAMAMSSIVFAGSAQFVVAQLFAVGTQGVVILLTVLVVNLRHMLYSASIVPHVRGLSRPWRWLTAYLLTDEAYAVAISHFRRVPMAPHKHIYLIGAGVGLWLDWQLSTAAGIYLGSQVPPGWSLEFTLALTLIAMVVPALADRAEVACAVAAGLVGVLAINLPYNTGLLLAAAVGILVGMGVDRIGREREAPSGAIPR